MIDSIEYFNKLQQGDKEAFDLIYKEFNSKLIQFAFSYVKDKVVAENLVQDAFLKLWQKREELLPNTVIPAFLTTLVKNSALNHLNHLKIEMRVHSNIHFYSSKELALKYNLLEECNPNLIFNKEIQSIIADSLHQLPLQTQEIFLKSRFQNKSYKEIAEEFNITEKGVGFHISKALKLLRETLKDYLPAIFITFLEGLNKFF